MIGSRIICCCFVKVHTWSSIIATLGLFVGFGNLLILQMIYITFEKKHLISYQLYMGLFLVLSIFVSIILVIINGCLKYGIENDKSKYVLVWLIVEMMVSHPKYLWACYHPIFK